MPRSKKQAKAGPVQKKGDLDAKDEGHWVHVEGSEQLHQDSWEIVESSQDIGPSESSPEIVDPKDDEIVDILTGNAAAGLLPSSSESLDFPQDMDKSSDFQIIEMKDPSLTDDDEEETSFIDSVNVGAEVEEETVPTEAPNMAPILEYPENQTCNEATPLKDEHTEPNGDLPVEEKPAKKTNKKSKGKKKQAKKISDPACPEGYLPVDEAVPLPGEVVIEHFEGSSSGDKPKEQTDVSPEKEMLVATADANADNCWDSTDSKSKKKKGKGKKNKNSASSLPQETGDRVECKPEMEIAEKKQEMEGPKTIVDRFVTVSKSKGGRDLSTLSVLLAKDETIENLTDITEKQLVEIKEQPPQEAAALSEVTVPEFIEGSTDNRPSDRESSVDDVPDVTETASNVGSNGSPKLSKSAKRRKKQKERMAKAIETFSNPALLMEKYEKSFGEPYKSPDLDLDDTALPVIDGLTCPVCLEVYYRPHLVQPCGHIFCEPCLRRLTTKSSTDVPCPMCRKIIISCTPEDELSAKVSLTYPERFAARNRVERRNKSRRNPLPQAEILATTHDMINKAVSSRNRSRNTEQKMRGLWPLSRSHIQKLLLVIICVISYIFTSVTIRAISSFFINNSDGTISNFFVLIVFCLYFYFIDKGIKVLMAIYEG